MGPAQAWFRRPFRNLIHRALSLCEGQANLGNPPLFRAISPIPGDRKRRSSSIQERYAVACEKKRMPGAAIF
jgi:hypothetical protein